MQDRKTAEAEKKPLGPMGKKKCPLEKKIIGWKISPALPVNVRTFPGMQDRKTAEAEKKPLGPRGGGKGWWKKKL